MSSLGDHATATVWLKNTQNLEPLARSLSDVLIVINFTDKIWKTNIKATLQVIF